MNYFLNQSALLFQGGMLLVRSKRYGEYVHLVQLSLRLARKKCNRVNDRLDMAVAVDWDVK